MLSYDTRDPNHLAETEMSIVVNGSNDYFGKRDADAVNDYKVNFFLVQIYPC